MLLFRLVVIFTTLISRIFAPYPKIDAGPDTLLGYLVQFGSAPSTFVPYSNPHFRGNQAGAFQAISQYFNSQSTYNASGYSPAAYAAPAPYVNMTPGADNYPPPQYYNTAAPPAYPATPAPYPTTTPIPVYAPPTPAPYYYPTTGSYNPAPPAYVTDTTTAAPYYNPTLHLEQYAKPPAPSYSSATTGQPVYVQPAPAPINYSSPVSYNPVPSAYASDTTTVAPYYKPTLNLDQYAQPPSYSSVTTGQPVYNTQPVPDQGYGYAPAPTMSYGDQTKPAYNAQPEYATISAPYKPAGQGDYAAAPLMNNQTLGNYSYYQPPAPYYAMTSTPAPYYAMTSTPASYYAMASTPAPYSTTMPSVYNPSYTSTVPYYNPTLHLEKYPKAPETYNDASSVPLASYYNLMTPAPYVSPPSLSRAVQYVPALEVSSGLYGTGDVGYAGYNKPPEVVYPADSSDGPKQYWPSMLVYASAGSLLPVEYNSYPPQETIQYDNGKYSRRKSTGRAVFPR